MLPNSPKSSAQVSKNSSREVEGELTVLNLAIHGAPASIHPQRPRNFKEFKAYRCVREKKTARDFTFPVDRIVYLAERLELTASTETTKCVSLSTVDVTRRSSWREVGAAAKKESPKDTEKPLFSLDLSSVSNTGDESDESSDDFGEASVPCNSRSSSPVGEMCETSRMHSSFSRCHECDRIEERSFERSRDLINLYINSVDKEKDLARFFRPCHSCKKTSCVCPGSYNPTRASEPVNHCGSHTITQRSCDLECPCLEFSESDFLPSFEEECCCRCEGGRESLDSHRVLAYTSSLANAARSARVLARDLELILSTLKSEEQ